MTKENTEDTEEVEQTYDYPMYRDVEGNDDFLEGEVGGFVENAEDSGEYIKYGDHLVPKEEVVALHESHDYDQRVQIYTVEDDD